MVCFRFLLLLTAFSVLACEAFVAPAGTAIQQHPQRHGASESKLQALFGRALVSSERTDSVTATVADPLNNRHSAADWLYNVRSFSQSKVLREIRNPVLSVTGWSLAVSVVHHLCRGSSSAFLNTVAAHMSIPGTAHSYLVSALGLLLVFRTNSAYQRFNVSECQCEARRKRDG